ncbi:MAG: HNH endonuclease signature motif containing protein [Candidatus Eisenbacteria bacterium]
MNGAILHAYSLNHLADDALERRLSTLVARERRVTARILAHIAEVDARKLYAPAGYPSMFAYCVEKLHLSEDAAYKRIQVARIARDFPALFPALADGRLHMAAVRLLAPHLTPQNVDELILAATRRTRVEVESMLACRFPRAEELTFVEPVLELGSPHLDLGSPSPEVVGGNPERNACKLAPGQVGYRLKPLSPRRFDLHVTIDLATRDHLERARELGGGDIEHVLARALSHYVAHLERRKFAATARSRRPGRAATRARTIPAHVRRVVRERDGGRCTFTSENGHRCKSRAFLEFDHVRPLARGGTSTAKGVRLLCRTHNQYEADRTFGEAFMAAQRARAGRDADVIAGLRGLGVSAARARVAVTALPAEATVEAGLRATLRALAPRQPQKAALKRPDRGGASADAVAFSR